jgi:hypothetical protein
MRRKSNHGTVRNLFAASLAYSILGAFSGVAYAFPGLGANCAQCHTDTGGGDVEATPSLLTLQPGESGTVTFDVSNLVGGAALSLSGFDVAGLEVTPDADWSERDGAARYTLSGIDADGQQTFDVTIGDGATVGEYPIGVFLAGGGSTPAGLWSTMSNFSISVAEIPEPATVVLLSIVIGVGTLGILRRRRRT